MNLRQPIAADFAADANDRTIDDRLVDFERRARRNAAEAARLADEAAEIRKMLTGVDGAISSRADPLVSIAYVAKVHGVSKSAARKKAWRMGLAVEVGGRVHVPASQVDGLYRRGRSTLDVCQGALAAPGKRQTG